MNENCEFLNDQQKNNNRIYTGKFGLIQTFICMSKKHFQFNVVIPVYNFNNLCTLPISNFKCDFGSFTT